MSAQTCLVVIAPYHMPPMRVGSLIGAFSVVGTSQPVQAWPYGACVKTYTGFLLIGDAEILQHGNTGHEGKSLSPQSPRHRVPGIQCRDTGRARIGQEAEKEGSRA